MELLKTMQNCEQLCEKKDIPFTAKRITEVVVYLLTESLKSGKEPFQALQSPLAVIKGAFA